MQSVIQRPTIRRYDSEYKVAKLFFGDNQNPLNGDYFMRGGICFPVPVRIAAECGAQGFALMAGYNVDTHKIYCFEEATFLSIDHIVGDHGQVEVEGLSQWFGDCWQYYFANHFYWHQEPETRKMYGLEIARSPMINPKPMLVHIDWTNSDNIEHTIWRMGNTGIFKFKVDGLLHAALRLMEVQTDRNQIIPGVQALKCVLAGLMRYPYKKKMEKT